MKFRKIFLSLLIILFIILVYKRFQMKPYSPENVEFSYEHKDKHIYLTMNSKNDYKIYYTLDGTIPTKNSILYTDTIELDRYSTPDYLVLSPKEKNIENKKNIFPEKSKLGNKETENRGRSKSVDVKKKIKSIKTNSTTGLESKKNIKGNKTLKKISK